MFVRFYMFVQHFTKLQLPAYFGEIRTESQIKPIKVSNVAMPIDFSRTCTLFVITVIYSNLRNHGIATTAHGISPVVMHVKLAVEFVVERYRTGQCLFVFVFFKSAGTLSYIDSKSE